ncbi:MAG: hypothetical protein V4646_03055 [Pseudomonadota bacterium]
MHDLPFDELLFAVNLRKQKRLKAGFRLLPFLIVESMQCPFNRRKAQSGHYSSSLPDRRPTGIATWMY